MVTCGGVPSSDMLGDGSSDMLSCGVSSSDMLSSSMLSSERLSC